MSRNMLSEICILFCEVSKAKKSARIHSCMAALLSALSTIAEAAWCVCVDKKVYLHVLFQLPSALQVVHIPLDGHVVQAQQAVESYAIAAAQLLLVGCLCHRCTPLMLCQPQR